MCLRGVGAGSGALGLIPSSGGEELDSSGQCCVRARWDQISCLNVENTKVCLMLDDTLMFLYRKDHVRTKSPANAVQQQHVDVRLHGPTHKQPMLTYHEAYGNT